MKFDAYTIKFVLTISIVLLGLIIFNVNDLINAINGLKMLGQSPFSLRTREYYLEWIHDARTNVLIYSLVFTGFLLLMILPVIIRHVRKNMQQREKPRTVKMKGMSKMLTCPNCSAINHKASEFCCDCYTPLITRKR